MKANFPLASLALFVTVAASLLACIDGQRLQQRIQSVAATGLWPIVSVFGGAALFGAMIGLIYLAFGRGNWRARLLAPVAGLFAGEIGLLILIAPGPIWRTTFAVGVLMLAAVLFRLGAE